MAIVAIVANWQYDWCHAADAPRVLVMLFKSNGEEHRL